MGKTYLHDSPFAILGASTRDDRRRIIELADEKSLSLDSEICQRARGDLTNPRTRLSAELAWLPGLSPKRATDFLKSLDSDPDRLRGDASLPSLANANLLAAALVILDPKLSSSRWCEWLLDLSNTVDLIDPDEVLREINEDRIPSGFPEVRSVDQVEEELNERRRFYAETIKQALDKFDSLRLVEVITELVDRATESGEQHAPQLIHEIVERYELEANRFLIPEAENIEKLVQAIREGAPKGPSAIKAQVDRLDSLVKKWDLIAQPIQVSMKAQGIDHALSHKVAWSIRSLAVDLFNKHDMLDLAKQLNSTLVALFEEVPEVAEKLSEDSDALNDISQKRQQAKLIEPLIALCDSISNHAEKNPSSADQDGFRALREGKAIISQLPVKAGSSLLNEAKDRVAAVTMHCAIEYGNKTSKWGPCVTLLEGALEIAVEGKLRQKIKENLSTVQRNERQLGGLEPISSAPSLSTINGCGFTLYGSTDQDASNGSYLSTYYFVVLAIPIFPISRYRVIPTGTGYRFLGKAPLRTMDIWHIVISVAVIVWMFSH